MGKFEGSPIDYASVLEAVPQPIAVCDIDGEVLFLNVMAREFLGLSNEDPLPCFALAERDTFSQVRIDQSGPFKEYFLADVEVRGAKLEHASMSLSPLGEERYRVVLEGAPRGMIAPVLDELDALVAICDQHRKIRLSNAALSRLCAEMEADATDCDVLELFAPEDRARLRVAASEALAGTTPEEVSAELAHDDVPLPAGHVRVRIRPMHDESDEPDQSHQRGFLLVAQVGEASFSELERRFARAEELMSLGEMATGVAHELKNPLTSILNYAQYLMEKYREQLLEKEDRRRLQRIIEGVERIDHFVHDLLSLAETDELDFESVDVHTVLRSSVQLNRRILDEHGVEVIWELDADDGVVIGHEGGLTQVFSNLLRNAARAMPSDGGTITVGTGRQGATFWIEVEDTAKGIPDEIRDRIFEPFFSSRKDGSGTGLGLALVERVVDQHGGDVEVESTPGQGSCFTINLPV